MNSDKERLKLDDNKMEEYLFQISSGDIVALEHLYKLTKSAVYGYALSILKNESDSEDVLQETYIKIYQGVHSYKHIGKPMAWILTITRNLALMKIRERKKMIHMPHEELISTYDTGIIDEDRHLINSLLTELKDEERQIVMLHSLSGLKHKEIAGLLSQPLSTILSKYSRAIKKLRLLLKEERYGE